MFITARLGNDYRNSRQNKIHRSLWEEFNSDFDLDYHLYGAFTEGETRIIKCKEARIASDEDLCETCGEEEKQLGKSICEVCETAGDV